MRHLSLLAVIALLGCGIPSVEPTSWQEQEELFQYGPYVVPTGGGKALIAVSGSRDDEATLEYWLEEPGSSTEDSVPAGAVVLAEDMREKNDLLITELDDLPVRRRIAYRIKSSRGTTPVYRFRIGRPDGEGFRFAAFGDTRTGHNIHRAVVEAVARERIDFVVNSGDLVDRGGVRSQWERFFQIEQPLLVDTPLFPAIGNHDWSGRQYFRRYFMLDRWTEDRRYYIQDWGNLRILTVDAGIECRRGCDQYRFAEQALAEGADKGMLMVMQLHFPPYSAGKHGSNTAVQRPITDLARTYGVELVIAGHDHNYERTKPLDGTTYVVTGSAGAPIRPVSPKSFTAHTRTEPHYVLFDVDRSHITLRAVNLQGEVFDSAVIQANPPRSR